MTRIVGILLARMGSSRLAGKSLALLYGRSVVGHILERMQAFTPLQEIILATPATPEDEALQAEGRRYGASIFGGSTDDVLDRLYQAAKSARAEVIVHVGGDQPFADPALMQKALDLVLNEGVDYACNFMPQTYPSGQEQDAFTFEALERAWSHATLKTHRVNAMSYVYHHQEAFRIGTFSYPRNMAHHRWTLDYAEDLTFFQTVYAHFYPHKPLFDTEDILAYLETHPEVAAINAHLSQYVPDQPAYWDSEGYMSDMRSDLRHLLEAGLSADEAGDMVGASRDYGLALSILEELHRRASKRA